MRCWLFWGVPHRFWPGKFVGVGTRGKQGRVTLLRARCQPQSILSLPFFPFSSLFFSFFPLFFPFFGGFWGSNSGGLVWGGRLLGSLSGARGTHVPRLRTVPGVQIMRCRQGATKSQHFLGGSTLKMLKCAIAFWGGRLLGSLSGARATRAPRSRTMPGIQIMSCRRGATKSLHRTVGSTQKKCARARPPFSAGQNLKTSFPPGGIVTPWLFTVPGVQIHRCRRGGLKSQVFLGGSNTKMLK